MSNKSIPMPTRYVAIYDFEANTPGDLAFKKGDTLFIINKEDDPNWWRAKASTSGKVGLIPANYVVQIPSESDKHATAVPSASAAPAAGPSVPTRNASSSTGKALNFSNTSEDERESNNKVRWFHGKITRDEAEELFKQGGNKDGLFLLRESTNYPGDYTLCVCFEGVVQHYRVEKGDDGKLSVDQESYFDDMIHLVDHYRLDSDGLCTRLSQPIVKRGAQPKIDPKIFKKAGWEINRSDIELGAELGRGNFGAVYEGTWRGKKVAVKKVLEPDAAEDFMAEASVMTRLRHKNLVQLMGVCSDDVPAQPLYIVTEFMSKGSLENYLRSRGRREITLNMLLMFSTQICAAMVYLESRNYVHRDLSARNVLVGEDNVAKVADFGLTKSTTDGDLKDSGKIAIEGGKIPIKWTAPEAISTNTYTNKSDVWSFGVVLWELYSYGRIPYTRMTHTQVVDSVNKGFRMEAPENCPPSMYEVMQKCWTKDPALRPSFKDVDVLLEKASPTALG